MRNFFLVVFFLGLSCAANAQYSRRTPFHPGWYISACGGVNYYLAEGFADYSINKALGSQGCASIGYKMNPVLGVCGSVGFSSFNWPKKNNITEIKNFHAQKMTLDMTVSMINWCYGYKKDRLFDFSLFAGAGLGQRDKTLLSSTMMTYIVRGGLKADYRISSSVSLSLLAEGNVIDDNFNDFVGVKYPFDIYSAISVGVSYYFPTSERILYSHRYNYRIKPKSHKKIIDIVFE